jgi:hypothetical protein
MTPLKASFYHVVTYQGKALIFIVDGRNLHLKGFTCPNGSFQLNLDEQREYYMLQKLCEMLNFCSNYHNLVDGTDLTPTGINQLRKENQLTPSLRKSFVIFVAHIYEPIRFQISLNHVNLSFTDASLSMLDKIACLSLWVKN